MSVLETILVGAFFLAWYYFALRRYNTLGFRIFSMFFFTAVAVCYWWSIDYRQMKKTEAVGVATEALVVKKATWDLHRDDLLTVQFADAAGATVERTKAINVSADELAAVHEGEKAPIIYQPGSDRYYLQSTFQRLEHDELIFLVFPGLLFLIGTLGWFFLRRYRVYAHEGTLYEYVTDESGRVVLDDNKNATTRALRVGSTLSKFLELFAPRR